MQNFYYTSAFYGKVVSLYAARSSDYAFLHVYMRIKTLTIGAASLYMKSAHNSRQTRLKGPLPKTRNTYPPVFFNLSFLVERKWEAYHTCSIFP